MWCYIISVYVTCFNCEQGPHTVHSFADFDLRLRYQTVVVDGVRLGRRLKIVHGHDVQTNAELLMVMRAPYRVVSSLANGASAHPFLLPSPPPHTAVDMPVRPSGRSSRRSVNANQPQPKAERVNLATGLRSYDDVILATLVECIQRLAWDFLLRDAIQAGYWRTQLCLPVCQMRA